MGGRILVTGAAGQVAADLVPALRRRYGADAVVAATHTKAAGADLGGDGPCTNLDVTDASAVLDVVETYGITTVYHLATLLSAAGETDPERAWRVNLGSLKTMLDIAVERNFDQLFWPSSIAVFGPTTPRQNTPQHTSLEPATMYGVTKLAGENICNYYARRYGLDVRSIRYPGLVTYKTFSGGGTTDYSVEIFFAARDHGHYTCFVRSDTVLPLMYMDDAIRATLELMEAPVSAITVRSSYNLTALSFTAGELAVAVAERLPTLATTFIPDFRQAIADSWPETIDDSVARRDWGWRHRFDLDALVDTMLAGVGLGGASG